MFGPNRIHQRFEERDHVMLGDFFDLGDASHIDLRLLTDFRSGSSRGLPGALESRRGLELDFQPDLVLVLEIPNGLHLRTGIAFDHKRSKTSRLTPGLPDSLLPFPFQLGLSRQHLVQNPVHEFGGFLVTKILRELDGFVHRHLGGHFVQPQQFIGAKARECCDPRSASGSLSSWSRTCRSAYRGPFCVPTRR